MQKPRYCKQCNKLMPGNKRTYCSEDCRATAKHELMLIQIELEEKERRMLPEPIGLKHMCLAAKHIDMSYGRLRGLLDTGHFTEAQIRQWAQEEIDEMKKKGRRKR